MTVRLRRSLRLGLPSPVVPLRARLVSLTSALQKSPNYLIASVDLLYALCDSRRGRRRGLADLRLQALPGFPATRMLVTAKAVSHQNLLNLPERCKQTPACQMSEFRVNSNLRIYCHSDTESYC